MFSLTCAFDSLKEVIACKSRFKSFQMKFHKKGICYKFLVQPSYAEGAISVLISTGKHMLQKDVLNFNYMVIGWEKRNAHIVQRCDRGMILRSTKTYVARVKIRQLA